MSLHSLKQTDNIRSDPAIPDEGKHPVTTTTSWLQQFPKDDKTH